MTRELPSDLPRQPLVEEVRAGNYAWCACGRTGNGVHCDGSHKGTEFRPVKLTLDEDKKVAWCQCRRTKNPPFCDGSHREA